MSNMYTYTIQKNDTWMKIAERFYCVSDEKFSELLRKKQRYIKSKSLNNHIGQDIELPDEITFSSKKVEIATLQSEENIKHYIKRYKKMKPIQFIYKEEDLKFYREEKDLEKNKEIVVVSRRLIHCWEVRGDKYLNFGILLTDDWGFPYLVGPFLNGKPYSDLQDTTVLDDD